MTTNHFPSLPLALAIALSAAPAVAQVDDNTALADLKKEIQALREEVATLKAAQPAPATAPAGTTTPAATTSSPETDNSSSLLGADFMKVKGLTLGFYGESKYRIPESGADVFDAHRYVLTPSYQINDWLVFNSEFELEHGAVDDSTARGSRFDGELELEQFYVDILINKHFNIRSPGIDLVPVGRINQIHEPTTFYSTERPELYREIIPTTWMEPSMSVFGQITDSLDYRLMVSAGLEDRIASAPTAAGVTAVSGLRDARPRLRRADESRLAVSGKLHFNGVEGLDASTSFYHSQLDGFDQEDVTMTLWDIEAQYRLPGTGLELRGDFAMWFIDNAENLIANNTGLVTDDIGERMYGWYVEAAYHIWPEAWRKGRGQEMDLVPFVRYSSIRTQSELLPGSAELDNGTANRDFLTLGLAYFLNPNFVVKADYRLNLDDSAATATSAASQDYVQLGVGVAF
jgi:hypothetical protein